MNEDFRADSSDEDEFREDMPMLQRNGSAAINAKLSFELPGQSGLQVSVHSPLWSSSTCIVSAMHTQPDCEYQGCHCCSDWPSQM